MSYFVRPVKIDAMVAPSLHHGWRGLERAVPEHIVKVAVGFSNRVEVEDERYGLAMNPNANPISNTIPCVMILFIAPILTFCNV